MSPLAFSVCELSQIWLPVIKSGRVTDAVYLDLALQGAFAEHQVMLQKLSLKRRVVIVLVRQPEDLDKCDALIIPGGGASDFVLSLR